MQQSVVFARQVDRWHTIGYGAKDFVDAPSVRPERRADAHNARRIESRHDGDLPLVGGNACRGQRIQAISEHASCLRALCIERRDGTGSRVAFEFLRRATHDLWRRSQHEFSFDGLEPLRRGGGVRERGHDHHLCVNRTPLGCRRAPGQQLDVEILQAWGDQLHVHGALLPAAPRAVGLLSHRYAEPFVGALQPCSGTGEARRAGESWADGVDQHLRHTLDLRFDHADLPHAADDRIGGAKGLRAERTGCQRGGDEEAEGWAHLLFSRRED